MSDLTAIPNIGRIDLQWTSHPHVANYAVAWLYFDAISGDGDAQIKMVGADGQATISGLKPGRTYYFVVKAVRWNTPPNLFDPPAGWSNWATETPSAGSPATDRAALIALYNATDGANWTYNLNWLSDGPIGSWDGVTTDHDGRVSRLLLGLNGLSGMMPAELGNLTNLEWLSLHGNQLTGEIPVELGNLTNLRDLELANNQLTGTIPSDLGNLTRLKWLYLSGNQLTGTIPAELGNLTNLESLYLSRNQLTGTIPSELGGITKLERLFLDGNQLKGTIPSELGDITNLVGLFLEGNQLTGTIPGELSNLLGLVSLSLGDNQLTGEIPSELENLTNLEWLWISGNQLTGVVPSELGNLPNLKGLELQGNHLTGCVPAIWSYIAESDLLDLSLPSCAHVPTTPSVDRTALVAFYNATEGIGVGKQRQLVERCPSRLLARSHY